MSEPSPIVHSAEDPIEHPAANGAAATGGPAIELCCLLRARPGAEAAMTAYEDAVLPLIAEHGGEIVSRAIGDGADGQPHEVHTYRFPGQAAIDAYMADPRRTARTEERDRTVASTVLFPVRLA
ncbi:hypothetical protein SAMN05216298_2708 [Glycomyces sambucus]|uniref:DUF1330 domain-containing protein n=1 Tax=Glycomyces sambucus TaxID=380244 RepID=A0A1G9H974_9ACTN|nr:hypothetical protein [Glycomyces sambucus]SDL09558.1 hypothetical protein SAMN05216298_2708 [Glycomyces sambucus]